MDDVAAKIEHTVLGPETTWTDVTDVLDAAIRYGMGACIPPCYVERADEYAPMVELTTVVGFPHGQHTPATKCKEAETAWKDGAAEVDVVVNRGYLDEDEDGRLETDIEEVVASVPVPVKIIVESPALEEDSLHRLGEIAAEAGVSYLKTATGFGPGGATVEDVELLSEYLPVKASGGVATWEEAQELFEAGAERIGTSNGDVIVEEYHDAQE